MLPRFWSDWLSCVRVSSVALMPNLIYNLSIAVGLLPLKCGSEKRGRRGKKGKKQIPTRAHIDQKLCSLMKHESFFNGFFADTVGIWLDSFLCHLRVRPRFWKATLMESTQKINFSFVCDCNLRAFRSHACSTICCFSNWLRNSMDPFN